MTVMPAAPAVPARFDSVPNPSGAVNPGPSFSPNVADVLRSQNNRGDHPTRKIGEEPDVQEVLASMVITPARPALVQVYEPRQKPEQEEVILEEFVLDGGETATREPRSATAAFRFLPLTEQQRQELLGERDRRAARLGNDDEARFRLTRGQEGYALPETADEMSAGEARQGELEQAEADAERGAPARKRAGGAERAGTGEAELQRGAEEKKEQTRRSPAPREQTKTPTKRSYTKRSKK